jgi:hypothetical protein
MAARSFIRIYHVTHPTGEHLAGLKAPRWPDAYTLALRQRRHWNWHSSARNKIIL